MSNTAPAKEPASWVKTKCPHCKDSARCRTSTQITALTRELKFQCSNIECGHTWVAYITAAYTISPSAIPDPSIDLPIGKQQTAQQIAPTCK